MQFSNFKNSETYHFFIWVSKSGYIDTQKLLFQAFEQVDKEPVTKGKDVFSVLKSNLVGALAEILDDLITDLDARDYFIGNVDGPKPIEMLWRPLLAEAFHKIDLFSVGEALLIRAAKRGARPNCSKNYIGSTRPRPRPVSKK